MATENETLNAHGVISRNNKECTPKEFWQERQISIAIEKLENFGLVEATQVTIQIEFSGNKLTDSSDILLNDDGCAETTVSAIIVIDKPDPRILDDILANPVIFTVLESSLSAAKTAGDQKPSPSTKSKSTSKSAIMTKPTIIGVCNMDISSLLTGQKVIRDSLIVEKNQKLIGHNATSWLSLPRLIVTATTMVDEIILESADPFNNVISVTVESVYNAPKSVPEGTLFDATFLLPCFGEKLENIVFKKGTATFEKDCEGAKKWSTMSDIEGPGNLTKSRINYESSDVFNPLRGRINLEDVFNDDSFYKILWNKWRRCILTKTGFNIFFEKISSYRVWPIEIAPASFDKVLGNGKAPKVDKMIRTATSVTGVETQNYIAFLDLSSLLYPGTTRVRVAAQLYTYSVTDLIKKWGWESSKTEIRPQTSIQVIRSKTASEKSKLSVPKESSLNEPSEDCGVPLYNEKRRPVFIIVEIEIWKPYIPKKGPEFLHERLLSYIPPKGRTPKKIMTCVIAEENFEQAIKAYSSTIQNAYRNYLVERKGGYLPENRDIYFYDYLCHTSDFQKIKLNLDSNVLQLIKEKFRNLENIKDIIPNSYVYLIEKVHEIIKYCTIGHSSAVRVEMDSLQLFAEEAVEEENYKRAKRFLLQKIVKFKSNPDYWLDYAEFSLKAGEPEKAIELIREALSWDLKHQIGLVMYGLSMATTFNYCIAETVLLVLLSKYPEFAEGWIIIYLYYLKVENQEGAQVSLQTAAKLRRKQEKGAKNVQNGTESLSGNSSCENLEKACTALADGRYGMASYVKGESSTDPLTWTISLCPENSLFIKTAVLLLKLGFYEFAELALAQEHMLENCGRSLPYLYYTAVSFYLRKRYKESLSLLEEAFKLTGKNCSLWSLMGHCYYKLKNNTNAVACYEYVIESNDRPDDIYLIYLRMCEYYLHAKKFHCMKKISMVACKCKLTPKILTFLGLACYYLTEFEEAELTFKEANYLDPFCPIIWGHLALANLQLNRNETFNQCYLEAKKKNLQDELLIEEIEKLRVERFIT